MLLKRENAFDFKGPLVQTLCEKYSENVSAITSAEMCCIPQTNVVSIHRRVYAFSQTTFLEKFLFLKIAYKTFTALRSNHLISNILTPLELFSNIKTLLQLSLWNHF